MREDAARHAAELHRQAVVIDGHSDILIPVTDGKMTLAERVEVPSPAEWQPPQGLERHPLSSFGMGPHTIYFGCMGQYDIPRWQEGGITTQLCAIYLDDEQLANPLQRGLEMVWNFHHEIESDDRLLQVTRAADIRRAKEEGKIGLVLAFEGCEALGSDGRFLDLYYRLGLRVASLTHTRRNLFADGCWSADRQGGLTAAGKQLIRRMNELRIVVDLVHIGEVGFWEVLDLVDQPLILSHTTPTMFDDTDPESRDLLGGALPRPRLQLPRDRGRLESLARNGGVLGMIAVAHRDLDGVVRDIETALEVMGPDHVGLGSDHYGLELAPDGVEDISKTPAITRALVERGHDDETILKFLGGNYLRVFEQVWG